MITCIIVLPCLKHQMVLLTNMRTVLRPARHVGPTPIQAVMLMLTRLLRASMIRLSTRAFRLRPICRCCGDGAAR